MPRRLRYVGSVSVAGTTEQWVRVTTGRQGMRRAERRFVDSCSASLALCSPNHSSPAFFFLYVKPNNNFVMPSETFNIQVCSRLSKQPHWSVHGVQQHAKLNKAKHEGYLVTKQGDRVSHTLIRNLKVFFFFKYKPFWTICYEHRK